jgi:hypothetical protein
MVMNSLSLTSFCNLKNWRILRDLFYGTTQSVGAGGKSSRSVFAREPMCDSHY